MMMFLKLLSPRAWLAIGAAVLLAVLIFLTSQLLGAHKTIGSLRTDLKACRDRGAALEQQIKTTAIEEGKRYADLEAQHLASCRDAYDAGAKRLRDDQAVGAGRYVPGRGASAPQR